MDPYAEESEVGDDIHGVTGVLCFWITLLFFSSTFMLFTCMKNTKKGYNQPAYCLGMSGERR